MIKIPIVDGPSKGEVFNDVGWNSKTFLVALPPDPPTAASLTDFDPFGPETKTAVYYIHECFIFGRTIRIASVQGYCWDVSNDDMFSVLASDKAKGAVVPE